MASESGKPILPVKNRLDSFWLTERDVELKAWRSTAELPSSADVVIVGSGMSGAMTSYHIYREALAAGKPMPRIVMLEADETTGSATARNGGHCKPITFIGYRANAEKHGHAVANHILEYEEAALQHYVDIVGREGIDCDLNVTRAFDCLYDAADAESARLDFEARVKHHPESVKKADLRLTDDLTSQTGVRKALFSANYPAGHLWPYKLATGLIKLGLKKGMNLQSYTPVTGLKEAHGGRWTVETARGSITTTTVVVASNAFTSSFLPEFRNLIIPIRGTACSITPAPAYSKGGARGPIPYTFGFRHATGDVDYMIARTGRKGIPGTGDQSIILGGAKSCFLKDTKLWYDNIDDSVLMPGVREYFEGFMKKHFVGWDGNAHGNVDRVWSGVLGYSSDFIPYIGHHPDRPGVFVCAGHNGHGMPRIPGATKPLATLLYSYLSTGAVTPEAQKVIDRDLPRPFHITKERMSSKTNVIKEAMGQGKAPVSMANNDEANMLAKVKAKL